MRLKVYYCELLQQILRADGMLKKYILLCVAFLGLSCQVFAQTNGVITQPVLFDPGIEQHGAFSAEDLRTSPLLRSMFNLSVNDVNSELVRICISPQNDCRVIKRDEKVYLVSTDGRVKFDNVN